MRRLLPMISTWLAHIQSQKSNPFISSDHYQLQSTTRSLCHGHGHMLTVIFVRRVSERHRPAPLRVGGVGRRKRATLRPDAHHVTVLGSPSGVLEPLAAFYTFLANCGTVPTRHRRRSHSGTSSRRGVRRGT